MTMSRKRRVLWWAGGLGLLVAAGMTTGAIVGAFKFRTPESASGSIHAPYRRPVLLENTEPPPGPDDRNEFRRTQLAYAKSRLVLNAALNNPELKNLAIIQSSADPIVMLENNLEVAFNGESDVLRFTFKAGTPEEQCVIIGGIMDMFLKEARMRDNSLRESKFQKLTEIWTEMDNRLKEKRSVIRRMSEDLGTMRDQEFKLKELLDRELEKEIVQVVSDLRAARFESVVWTKTKKRAELELGEQELREKIQMLEAKVQFLEEAYRTQHASKKRKVDVEWLVEDIEAETQLLRRLNATKSAMELEMRAPDRYSVLDPASIGNR